MKTACSFSFALFVALMFTGCGAGDDVPADLYFPLPESAGELHRSVDQEFYVQTLVDGLQIPWGMTFLSDGVMLITERGGTIRMVVDGVLQETPVGGGPEVFVSGTSGLLDIAAHPDFEENRLVYITYSLPEEGRSHTALMRAKLEGTELVQQEVLFVGEPKIASGSHSGSRIAFRDGYVFFSVGDRGNPVMNTAQELNSHNGSIIRLYEDGSLPLDNPFVDREGARPEIWSYGHRNPQGLAFNPVTGSLWSNEHGPDGGDEVNVIEKGENYGWPLITHGQPDRGTTLTGEESAPGMRSAHHFWRDPVAPSGLEFVTGGRYPAWEGDVMISTLRGMRLIRLRLNGDEILGEEDLLEGYGRMRNVKMGPDKFLYIALDSGEIIRLIPADLLR